MPRLGITVTDEMHKELLALSEQTGVPASEIVRRLLADHLKKQGKPIKTSVQHGGNRRQPPR